MEHQAVDAFIMEARDVVANGRYSTAFDMYLTAFNKWPFLKTIIDGEFRSLLNEFNTYLLNNNRSKDIFDNFERSVECLPDNLLLMNDIGIYLYKYGFYKEACGHFQQALALNAEYVDAQKNLDSVKNLLVSRWHFRMLNDRTRNTAYHNAICKSIVRYKTTLLDIGAGTGILSAYALKCKPALVAACDGSKIMRDIACSYFEENEIKDVIYILKMSQSLTSDDIGGRYSIVLTEIFDAGLFGEQALQTLQHAWKEILAKGGFIIPGGAEFFVVGANCNYLSNRYRLSDAVLALLNISKSDVCLESEQPYDSEDVYLYKELKYVTEPQSVLKIDFNNVEDITDKLINEQSHDIILNTTEDSEINIIVGWFNLHLIEGITVTTNPMEENRATAWQQAVFYDFIPKIVKVNDAVPFKFSTYKGKLMLVKHKDEVSERVSSEMIRFLNDSKYMQVIMRSIGTVFIYVSQIIKESLITILDLSPFPLLGLMLMKRGAKHLTCYAKTMNDKRFITKVFEENNIPISRINIILEKDLSTTCFINQKYHIMYCNLLELCGDLNLLQKEIFNHVKVTNLADGGLVLPFKVTIKGQLIHSDWLENNNLVNNENTLGFKVAEHINVYQVFQNFHIDIFHLEHQNLSEVISLGVCSDDMASDIIEVTPLKGEVTGILCWYNTELIEKGEVLSTKEANSYINSTVFRVNPYLTIGPKNVVNILRCVDSNNAFKFVLDVE